MGGLLSLLLASFIEAAPADPGGRAAALGSAREARVAAQFGQGLEEAATQRDYDGIGEFVRKLGGWVKAVRILIGLDAGDSVPEAGGGAVRSESSR